MRFEGVSGIAWHPFFVAGPLPRQKAPLGGWARTWNSPCGLFHAWRIRAACRPRGGLQAEGAAWGYFLRPKNANAARRAGEAIRQGVRILGEHAQIGRLVKDLPEPYREWPIDFGDSGYVARYRLDDAAITILAIRHQKESEVRDYEPV